MTGEPDPQLAGLTAELVSRARLISADTLPADVVRLAAQCLLDWFAVTIAGSTEPVTTLLRDDVLPESAPGPAVLVGTGERVGASVAALINGTAAHALDYDDVVPAMSGHPSAPVLAALLPLAEERRLDVPTVVAAFVAGFEMQCRLGRVLSPGHYASGWHATGTLGTIGAAAACAHALGLDEPAWRNAIGLAATQAAGLRGVFGTMSKPLHAGNAALHGQRAARLAARGVTSNPDILEATYGFAATMSRTADRAGATATEFDLLNVLFKYHAACYGAHAAMDAIATAAHAVPEGDIAEVVVRVPPVVLAQCGRPEPVTDLEAKFSIPFAAALVIAGAPTGPSGFSAQRLADPRLRSLARLVRLEAAEGMATFAARAELRTTAGRQHVAEADVSIPVLIGELDAQQARLTAKFGELVEPVLGAERADRLLAAILDVGAYGDDVGGLVALATRATTQLPEAPAGSDSIPLSPGRRPPQCTDHHRDEDG